MSYVVWIVWRDATLTRTHTWGVGPSGVDARSGELRRTWGARAVPASRLGYELFLEGHRAGLGGRNLRVRGGGRGACVCVQWPSALRQCTCIAVEDRNSLTDQRRIDIREALGSPLLVIWRESGRHEKIPSDGADRLTQGSQCERALDVRVLGTLVFGMCLALGARRNMLDSFACGQTRRHAVRLKACEVAGRVRGGATMCICRLHPTVHKGRPLGGGVACVALLCSSNSIALLATTGAHVCARSIAP
jgi:hypothetical protein